MSRTDWIARVGCDRTVTGGSFRCSEEKERQVGAERSEDRAS